LRGERGCLTERLRAAEWKDAAASGCDWRSRGGGGCASGGGGGRGGEGQGEGGGGMRDAGREGSRGTTHVFVSSLVAFCVRSLQTHLRLSKPDVHNCT